ncbi:MAG: hypothetical protein EOM90_04790 [Alphaproteobacteria bacterium]|nr:hypothetical protein [Alphaproteobacteria bacterium]
MDHEIYTWLNSDQDYPEGLLIYDRYCRNANLGRILRIGGATGKNRLTLAYQLSKVISPLISHLSIQSPEPQEPEKDKVVISIPAIRIEDLRQQQKMIYKMLDNLHAILEYRSVQERKEIAFQILDLDDQLRDLAGQIDHYEKHGVIPVSQGQESKRRISELSDVELFQWQSNLRTYVTRYKRLVAGSKTPESLSRNQELLQQYQDELAEITKRLQR